MSFEIAGIVLRRSGVIIWEQEQRRGFLTFGKYKAKTTCSATPRLGIHPKRAWARLGQQGATPRTLKKCERVRRDVPERLEFTWTHC